jgi:hypothetical protein
VCALFDRRDGVYVVTIGHDEHDLPRISPLVWVDENAPEPVFLNCKNDLLERDSSL